MWFADYIFLFPVATAGNIIDNTHISTRDKGWYVSGPSQDGWIGGIDDPVPFISAEWGKYLFTSHMFGSARSADSVTIYTIYLSHCTQTAVPKFPNFFRGKHCITDRNILSPSPSPPVLKLCIIARAWWAQKACQNVTLLLADISAKSSDPDGHPTAHISGWERFFRRSKRRQHFKNILK